MTYMNVMLGGQSGRRAPVRRFTVEENDSSPVGLSFGGRMEAEGLLEHGAVAAEKWLGPEEENRSSLDVIWA